MSLFPTGIGKDDDLFYDDIENEKEVDNMDKEVKNILDTLKSGLKLNGINQDINTNR
jgi:hypothetical protein